MTDSNKIVFVRRDDDGTYTVGLADNTAWADAIEREHLAEAVDEWCDIAAERVR